MPYFTGPTRPVFAIVGEAPGYEEEKRGLPFVGASGKLLDDLLERAGVARHEVYLDNVFQFRPMDNNIRPFISFSKNGSVTTSPEWTKAKADLLERLSKIETNVIVVAGNVPLFTLLGMVNVTSRRGSVYLCPELDNRKIIPMIHPAAAIYAEKGEEAVKGARPAGRGGFYLYENLITFDLRRAKQNSTDRRLPYPERTLRINPTFKEVLEYLELCRISREVAVDIEVRSGEISHISFATSQILGMSIPFFKSGSDYFTSEQEAEIWKRVAGILEDENILKIGHNITFDATFIFHKMGIITRPLGDTMVAAAIVYPDYPKKLEFVQSIFCDGTPYYKEDRKSWQKLPTFTGSGFSPEDTFQRYNAMDSVILMDMYPKLLRVLENQNNIETYKRQMRLIPPIIFICEHGVRMDIQGMREGAIKARREVEELSQELNTMAGTTINANSYPQVRAYFYGVKGLKPYTKKGGVTVDDKALSRIARRGFKEAQIILDIRSRRKLIGTYFEVNLDEDQRLRGSGNPVGTIHGRMSSSETIFGTGGNMQNQPEEMRRLMLADPGYILVSQDLSQAENRIVAYLANETRMISAFEQGIDVHSQTGALIRGIPIEEVTPEIRFEGKVANHGLNYALGYKNFALHYGLQEARAKVIVERYHQIYPRIRSWHSEIEDTLNAQSRTLINLFGRWRRFQGRWGHELFKEAYDYIPQSTVADLLNLHGFIFLYERQDLFPEVILLNNIHDSVLYEIPLEVGFDRIIQIIEQVKVSLERTLTWKDRAFYIPVDTKIGFRLEEEMVEIKAASFPSISTILGEFLHEKGERLA